MGRASINGLIYNRGSAADYDDIVARGNPGWGWDEMLRIFRTIEDHGLRIIRVRGAGGPLGVSVISTNDDVSEALMDAATTLGIKRVDDINASDEERTGYAAATMRNGKRVSPPRLSCIPR